jgi:hypothetical protein
MLTQILTAQTKIAFEIQHRHTGGRHHFGVRHLAMRIFIVLQGFQHIITQTKYNYNLGVHEFLLYSGGWDTSTVLQTMDFSTPATLGSNLG